MLYEVSLVTQSPKSEIEIIVRQTQPGIHFTCFNNSIYFPNPLILDFLN